MSMRDVYAYAIQTAKGKFHGSAEEHDGKLHFKGTIKTIPTWQKDVVAGQVLRLP